MNNIKQDREIRWMTRSDYPEVLDIESDLFEFPWSEEDLIRCMRQRNCIGMVVTESERIAGYTVYELHDTHLHVLNFAVSREYRKTGVGTKMVRKLITKLSQRRRTHILLEVREKNLPAQLFFHGMGFTARKVLRDFYDGTNEDAYRFRYDVRNAVMTESAEQTKIAK